MPPTLHARYRKGLRLQKVFSCVEIGLTDSSLRAAAGTQHVSLGMSARVEHEMILEHHTHIDSFGLVVLDIDLTDFQLTLSLTTIEYGTEQK